MIHDKCMWYLLNINFIFIVLTKNAYCHHFKQIFFFAVYLQKKCCLFEHKRLEKTVWSQQAWLSLEYNVILSRSACFHRVCAEILNKEPDNNILYRIKGIQANEFM